VGYFEPAVALAGLSALASGSTPWILAGGVITWLVTVPVTLTGFLWARRGPATTMGALCGFRASFGVSQVLVHEGDRHASLTDGCRNALHGTEAHVAAGEDAGHARFE